MSTVAWFPDAFEHVPEAAIERLTNTARKVDAHGSCCLWTWIGDKPTTCIYCRIPGALLVGHTGQYVITQHVLHGTSAGDAIEHQALWIPHTCKET